MAFETLVGDVLDAYPMAADVFVAHGVDIENCRHARRTLGDAVAHHYMPVDVKHLKGCQGFLQQADSEWECSLQHAEALIAALKDAIGS